MRGAIAKRAVLALAAATLIGGVFGGPALGENETSRIVATYPAAAFETTTPEAAGWSAATLAEAKSWSRLIAPTAAVMIVQHGRIVAQWGDITTKSNLHSVRKSLLSALIGIAVDQHRIDLNASLSDLGIDDNAPGLSETEKSATVSDLLKARSGVYHAALYETKGMARRRPLRGSHAPGTFWYYNNWDFNALGTIYEKAAAQSIFSAFDRQIARPIGMQDYGPSDGSYVRGAASNYPAYPIRMSARDLARFALLYLHEGQWGDRQIVPRAWVRASVKSYSTAYPQLGPGLGYGYLWWIGFLNDTGAPTVKVPAGTYEAMGAEGQYAFVIPAYDLVIVHRINSDAALAPSGSRRPTPSFRQIGRLLWLILSAAGDRDIGPDASLAHADGERLDAAALKTALSDKNLLAGTALAGGPFVWQLHGDGTALVLAGAERRERSTGTWHIDDRARYCRTLTNDDLDRQAAASREHCFDVIVKGERFQFFDADGLMQYDTRAE
ncbi:MULTISPECIES: serine hydrolase [unclassified Bradyrhizobium]|uniref:serine hydrolase domain-containing protein n=1 Tax=unclassified Bradyrhizobium TaxID=2631580 RepID=UPI00291684FC|nr:MULTISPECIES: serine hydrolase [unclassified Bradyrhizobium]